MPSERRNIDNNANGSKNTRMDLDTAIGNMDIRKDELMHIARYQKFCKTVIDLAKALGRPVKVLDLGCGEIYNARMLYKAFVVKKEDVISRYVGVDIDKPMLDRVKETYHRALTAVNGKLICKDLTQDRTIKVSDGYFDVVVWYEMIEHINPKFVPGIIKEVSRVLNPEGVGLISTPNSNGSNAKLPKDHFYEWSYEELIEALETNGLSVDSTYGVSVNPSKVPMEELARVAKQKNKIWGAFGSNTAFSCVALAPMIKPTYCKNVLYTVHKGGRR